MHGKLRGKCAAHVHVEARAQASEFKSTSITLVSPSDGTRVARLGNTPFYIVSHLIGQPL